MQYDLKITGGTLIDGTGAPGYLGDLGIKDGRIVAVGEAPGEAKETLDATGTIVTPGFTDIHTHLDGQVSWDEEMAPSSLSGVTTVVMGSCGVGFGRCALNTTRSLSRSWKASKTSQAPLSALASNGTGSPLATT